MAAQIFASAVVEAPRSPPRFFNMGELLTRDKLRHFLAEERQHRRRWQHAAAPLCAGRYRALSRL